MEKWEIKCLAEKKNITKVCEKNVINYASNHI